MTTIKQFFKKEKQQNAAMTSIQIRRMVVSAMFLCMALVIRTYFSHYVPIFGETGMRISIHGIFSVMPALLFGPFYGAVVSGLTDFLGHHLRPMGAFNPYLTLTAAMGGFIRGALWMLIRERSDKTMRYGIIGISTILIFVGAYGVISFNRDGLSRDFYEAYTLGSYQHELGFTAWIVERDAVRADHDINAMALPSRIAITNSLDTANPTMRLGEFFMLVNTMLGGGFFGFLLVGINWLIGKYMFKETGSISTTTLLVALLVPAVLVSIINTHILRETQFLSWQLLPFWVIGLPRLMQAVATTTIMAYFVAMLLNIFRRQPNAREIMK